MRQILASMRDASIFLVAVFGLIGLSGCGTPAYRIAKSECRNLAENGGDKLVHGSGGIFPAAGGIKPCHL